MKKTITLLLTLGLLLGLLPVEAAAFAGDIYRAGDVKQVKMADGSLSLQNGYVHVTLHKLLETYSYLTVVPAAKPDEDFLWNSQTPRCNYTRRTDHRGRGDGTEKHDLCFRNAKWKNERYQGGV